MFPTRLSIPGWMLIGDTVFAQLATVPVLYSVH